MRSYDEFIEKTAAAKWKKEFANLSGANQRKLVREFVDTDRYIKGIEKGNQNLIRELRPKIVNDKNKLAMKLWSDKSYAKGAWRGSLGDTVKNIGIGYVAASKDAKKDQDMIFGFRRQLLHPSRRAISNKRMMDVMKRAIPDKKLSRQDKRALNAVTLRHELDELRSKRRHGLTKWPYASHNAPDVIHRESANLAFMPKNVKKIYRRLREDQLITGDFRYTTGKKYLASPYFDKKKADAHVKKW